MTSKLVRPGLGELWTRACRLIVATGVVLGLSAVVAEVAARYIFGLSPLVYTRPPHPVLFAADETTADRLSALYDAPGGPTSLGYRPAGLAFQVDPDAAMPASMTSFADFLFDHKLARYSAADVDRLLCNDPDASALLVLGASAAQGFAATSSLLSWHALLEDMLRRRLGKSNLYVFNAAMGGYTAFQDKLAYYLAAAPRVPVAVLFYNAGNDMQVLSRSRPGDPPFLGTWYGSVYGDRLLLWLAEHSAIINTLMQQGFAASFSDFVARLDRDDALFERHAKVAITLYLELMSEILAACEAQRRPCWVAIQPNRALTSARTGGSTADVVSSRRVQQIYAMLAQRIAAHRYRDHFIDLTGIFDGGDGERYFTDTVHVADKGHPLIAEALAGPLAPALQAPLPRGRAVDRCAVLPAPQVLTKVALDDVVADLPETKLSYAAGVLSLHLGPARWLDGAHAVIKVDPAWAGRELIIRVRLAVTKGDVAVVVDDGVAGKALSPERAFKAGDPESTAYLPIRGHPSEAYVIFRKTLPDGVPSDAVVQEISVLAR